MDTADQGTQMSSSSHEISPERTSPSSSPSKSQMLQLQTNLKTIKPTAANCQPRFLGLPLEIRNIIYEMCLCIKGCIIPYKDASQPDCCLKFLFAMPSPSLAILSTNKQIREEALHILFGKNWFHITPHGNCLRTAIYKDDLIYHPTNTNGDLGTPCTEKHQVPEFWRTYGRYMKQIVMNISIDHDRPLFVEPPPNRKNLGHHENKNCVRAAFAGLAMNWQEMVDYLQYCTNVNRVWIEVGTLTHIHSPCRLRAVRRLFRHHLVMPNPHVNCSITGTEESEEEEAIVDEWRARESERWQDL